MPYYEKSEEWLRQSQLLLEARPSTTRTTTKYHISKPSLRNRRHSKTQAEPTPPGTTTGAPRGVLTLKTFDPVSGVCLKYKTTKMAEVSRLILHLGTLGRKMAALPEPEEADATMAETAETAETEKGDAAAAAPPTAKETSKGQTGGAGGSGGGGKKKKKGKK
ncbi:signal recognition particle 9 kDa protein-domain-containing protein [Xylariaceae sp. FL0016]|nr:signal recognition particle 9 kDa protein-domain-containing protein [Xylariaceae sp. FL0016]